MNAHIEVLYAVIGGNLSEERFSPVPPSKDFYSELNPHRVHPDNEMLKFHQNGACTLWGFNFKMKVLGKEFEENPFEKGFSSTIHANNSV